MSDLERQIVAYFTEKDGAVPVVVKYRESEDSAIALIDYGIGGVKKFAIPYDELPELEADPVDYDLHNMRKPELVDLAESLGLDTDGLTVKELVVVLEEALAGE